MEYIHHRGFIHRDIKPENILLRLNGDVVLADTGLMTCRRQGLKARVGTPQFVAPEIVRGEEYDERVDSWSFAVTLYEIVTGGLPFESPSGRVSNTMWEICYAPIAPRLMRVRPVGEFVFNVMRNILVRDPRGRAKASDVLKFIAKYHVHA